MTSQSTLAASGTGPLTVERDGAVLVIGLDRAAKRNALDDAMIAALDRVFSAIPEDVRAIVLHGLGPHFSAGLDLSELKERDVVEGIFHSASWHRAFEKIQYGRAPVVAALQGGVIGGGLELAASTHIRVADTTAYYAMPEGQRGIYVGGGASVRVPRLIGVARMADMMLTGRTYAAEEGLKIGFSQYVVSAGTALQKARELAHKIAANAGLTNFAVMHALPRIAEMAPSAGFMAESLMAAIAQASPEAKARLRAFLDKKADKVTKSS